MRRQAAGGNRNLALHVACAAIALLVLLAAWSPEPRLAFGMEQSHRAKAPAASTPVSAGDSARQLADPLDGDRNDGERRQEDPLDGDPLDGAPVSGKAKDEIVRLEITRSGRPEGAPSSVVAYDDDPDTEWRPEESAAGAWLWLDLGEVRELNEVRWLASGAGRIAVALSDDRKEWRTVETIDVGRSWQETALKDEARYVRLSLTAEDEGDLPAITEIEVYGSENASTAREQKAKSERKGNKNKNKDKKKGNENKKDKGGKNGTNKDDNADSSTTNDKGGKNDKGNNSGGSSKGNTSGGAVETRDGISVQAGETHCQGDRNRCRAQAGEVDVQDDCGNGSTCTIDIQADGGSANCDSTGGDENKAGNGEGKRSGDGGRCEAVANGGAVSIGDINP